MALEKLPKEDGLFKTIQDIQENEQKNFIDVRLSADFLFALKTQEWFDAFQEHYFIMTNERVKYSTYDGPIMKGMRIPEKLERIDFRVDASHQNLKFFFDEEDKRARDVVYKFIERLMQKSD